MMSTNSAITKLESLPNELLLGCFEYLTQFDLLSAFTVLNERFDRLLACIPMNLNFEHTDQSTFVRLEKCVFASTKWPKQIHSLHLSDADPCWQMQSFLPQLVPRQLAFLRSLTLTEVVKENFDLLKSIAPLLSRLTSFHYNGYHEQVDAVISLLPMTECKEMTIPMLPADDSVTAKLSSLTNLSVLDCEESNHEEMLGPTSSTNVLSGLKELLIQSRYSYTPNPPRILQQTNHLTSLKINKSYFDNPIRAFPWEALINSFLPSLLNFQFCFSYSADTQHQPVRTWFEEFQTHFWIDQHRWLTDYHISKDSAMIYTVPYFDKRYALEPHDRSYSNPSIDRLTKYDRVTELTVIYNAPNFRPQEYFPHVTDVTLSSICWFYDYSPPSENILLDTLKTLVNLSRITHLAIGNLVRKPSTLFRLLSQAPLLSSLAISPACLKGLLSHPQLCNHLSAKIRQLRLTNDGHISNSFYSAGEFCQTFSALERLTCLTTDEAFLFCIIANLPRLSWIVFATSNDGRLPRREERILSSLQTRLQTLPTAVILKLYKGTRVHLFRR